MKIINQYLLEYSSDTCSIPENWSVYEVGPEISKNKKTDNKYEWIAHSGGNDWEPSYVYNSILAKTKYSKEGKFSRVWYRTKYPENINLKNHDSSDYQKKQMEWGEKGLKLWLSLAKKLRAQHAHEKNEWNIHMDKENEKSHRDRNYKRDIPDLPEFDGNWLDAFLVAIKSKEMKIYVDEWGVDITEWKASNPEHNYDLKKHKE